MYSDALITDTRAITRPRHRGYLSTEGRTGRRQFLLEIVLPAAVLFAGLFLAVSGGPDILHFAALMVGSGSLIMVYPAVRRLHDLDASGAWLGLALVPLANLALMLVLLLKKGTPGDNQYGSDPMEADYVT